jgi:hypothetical protein
MVSSFAFVVIKGPSLIKIISARNQDIIMLYEAVIKVVRDSSAVWRLLWICCNRNYSAILATLQITSYALGV